MKYYFFIFLFVDDDFSEPSAVIRHSAPISELSDEESSDTSDEEDLWFGNLSPASSDSSLAEYGKC